MQTPPWILKSCFAYSGGFAPPSIRKICTLHCYEIGNLALLKFGPIFHLLSTLVKMLNSRLTYSVCPSFLLVNDLSPVSIWGLTKMAILQRMMVWNVSQHYFPLITVQFKNETPLCMHGALFHKCARVTHARLKSPMMAFPCFPQCVQTELPQKCSNTN